MTLEQINGKYPNIGLITFTSDGYTDLTKNLSTSIKQNNVDLKLNIFCLDSKSFSTNFGKKY